MKVIDLLNKISNGEEVPQKIKVDDKIYYYDETDSAEFYRYRGEFQEELLIDYANLNDEVEIIEEDKKIKPLFYAGNDIVTIAIKNKINEIIDYLNKGEYE